MIMCRGDFDGTRPKSRIGVFIGDNWDLAIDGGDEGEFADEVFVTLVIGIDGRQPRRPSVFRDGW
jgi:hypothetical protein